MVFSSIVFLCIFLPAVLILYYICPVRMRNFFLLIASLLFYAWGEPTYVWLLLFSTVFDYLNGRLLEFFHLKNPNHTARRLIVTLSICVNLGLLCYYKYADFLIETVNLLSGRKISLLALTLPIGISFYTFQTMSYTIDVYRQKVPVQHNLISFGMYVCMFPQLIAGPIVRYRDVQSEIDSRSVSIANCASGIRRFCIGLGKKVLFANQIGILWNEISTLPASEMSAALAWLGAISYMFQIYFDFSGYSDMAIGLGELFGFHFPENFHYPYEAKSISEFWRRWHMTLSGWFREYVYIPLGGNRVSFFRQFLNLLIVWFLTGFWHGAGWNFIVWGLYFFLLLFFEKQYLFERLDKLPSILQHLYALFWILFGWVIFACDQPGMLKDYLKMLISIGVPAINQLALYKWTAYALFLIVLGISSTSLLKNAVRKISVYFSDSVLLFLHDIWCFIVLACSLALLVNGSYNPFLYFRF